MNNRFQEHSIEMLCQLKDVILHLNADDYRAYLPILSEQTIGKHIRHVLEFFQAIEHGLATGYINYDARKRNVLIENDKDYAMAVIDEIIETILTWKHDQSMLMIASYESDLTVSSSLFRELSYNIEHTVHHMAIIKIAIEANYSYVQFPEHFGVAYSTVQYQKQCAQ